MAINTAKRINHFLNLPVTVVTDTDSLVETDVFDNIITTNPNKSNRRDWGQWINKDRYRAYELTPYDETILLDTDYVVNSDKILKLFEYDVDFMCHDHTEFLMQPGLVQEKLSVYSCNTLWATVVKFRKTDYVKQIFDCLKMVQNNYLHYSMIHGFSPGTYRNDYGLTIATRIVNGHYIPRENIIPWPLYHVGKNTQVYKNDSDMEFDTTYTITFDNWVKGKIRKEYLTIKDMDFHVMVKENFLELIQ
jgi:hypothetical protein